MTLLLEKTVTLALFTKGDLASFLGLFSSQRAYTDHPGTHLCGSCGMSGAVLIQLISRVQFFSCDQQK